MWLLVKIPCPMELGYKFEELINACATKLETRSSQFFLFKIWVVA